MARYYNQSEPSDHAHSVNNQSEPSDHANSEPAWDEPEWDNEEENDMGTVFNLKYGQVAQATQAANGPMADATPFWGKWLSEPSGQAEASGGAASTGAPPPAPPHVRNGDLWTCGVTKNNPPSMHCHVCDAAVQLDDLIRHVTVEHEAPSPKFVDVVNEYIRARCFQPMGGWKAIHIALATEKGVFVYDKDKPVDQYGIDQEPTWYSAPPLVTSSDEEKEMPKKKDLKRELQGATEMRAAYIRQRTENGLMDDDDEAATIARDEHEGRWVSGCDLFCRRAAIQDIRFVGTDSAGCLGGLTTSMNKCDVCGLEHPMGHLYANVTITQDGTLQFMTPHSSTVARAKQDPFKNVFHQAPCILACVFCVGYSFVPIKDDKYVQQGLISGGKGPNPQQGGPCQVQTRPAVQGRPVLRRHPYG
jgi:hypothetical protein